MRVQQQEKNRHFNMEIKKLMVNYSSNQIHIQNFVFLYFVIMLSHFPKKKKEIKKFLNGFQVLSPSEVVEQEYNMAIQSYICT